MEWDKHNDKRMTKLANYDNNQKIEATEVWIKVKQYYKDLE